ncbi:MAG: di-trans,poly-cis-decaprenylcistransferase, partial [Candidatus Omnitrophica bacterium CG12_big_fil_rev_8_21_14_0_65_50_5]
NMRFQMIGRRDKIPDSLWGALEAAVKETQHNTGLVVNLAFNYGSRLEIIDAVREIAALVQLGELTPERIDEELISRHLYTRSLPDPDLLVRTSGEKRISNFLLWQLSYAEFYFTEVLWPDFTVEEFHKAIADYQTRDRRFGAVKSNGS